MSEEQFARMIELLEEIRKWSRFQSWKEVKEVLLDVLSDDASKLIYHYSDGRSSREVAEYVDRDFGTIVRLWKKWAEIGIVEAFAVQRGTRYKRLFSLEDFGIEIPQVSLKEAQIQAIEEPTMETSK